jgi:hypothetical protein
MVLDLIIKKSKGKLEVWLASSEKPFDTIRKAEYCAFQPLNNSLLMLPRRTEASSWSMSPCSSIH